MASSATPRLHRPWRPATRGVVAGAVMGLFLFGCSDIFTDPAPPAAVPIAVSFNVAAGGAGSDAGSAEAFAAVFDKADRVRVVIQRQGSPVVDEVRSFTSSAETRLSFSLGVQDPSSFRIIVTLLAGSDPLFAGAADAVITPGATNEVPVTLAPVAAAIDISAVPELTSVGQSVQAQAVARFATGDPLPGLALVWTTSNTAVAEVDAAGVVTARGAGTTVVNATGGGVSGAASVTVRQVPVRLLVVPTTATVGIDATVTMTADFRDAGDHPIAGLTASWSTVHPAVATVSSSGVVTGVAEGTTNVSATGEGLTGQAVVQVRPLARIVASPASAGLRMAARGPAPAPTAVSISNGEAGPLTRLSLGTVRYAPGGPTGWLDATLASASAPTQLTLAAPGADLPVGSYTAWVPIVSPAAVNTPFEVAVTLVVEPPPRVVASPAEIAFQALAGGAAPQPGSITLANGGGGQLDDLDLGAIDYLGGPGGWLAATLSGSTAPSTLWLAPASAGLQPGTYTARVPVRSQVAAGELAVTVTLVVQPPPIIGVSPADVTINAINGGLVPPAKLVTLTNEGGGSLDDLTVGSVVYEGEPRDWLVAELTGPSAPSTLSLTLANTAMPAGTYLARVPVRSQATHQERDVEVTLVVGPPAIMTVTPSTITLHGWVGEANPPDQTVTIGSTGAGELLGLQVEPIEYVGGGHDWLSATLDRSTGPAVLTVRSDVSGLGGGTHTARIPVSSPTATNSPMYVDVVLEMARLPEIVLGTKEVTLVSRGPYEPTPVRHVAINNAGDLPLIGLRLGSVEYVQGDYGWLDAYIDGGPVAPTTLVLTLEHYDVSQGTHVAIVPVVTDSAINSPQMVTVTLEMIYPPDVWSIGPSDVTETSAVLNALAYANGNPGVVWVEWGLSPSDLVRGLTLPIGPIGDPHALSFPLSGLQIGTSYYYEFVAETTGGLVRSGVQQFSTTPPSAEPGAFGGAGPPPDLTARPGTDASASRGSS